LSRRYRETDPGDPFIKKISQFVTEISCPVCLGHRLKREFLSIFVGGKHIGELCELSVGEVIDFFQELPTTQMPEKIVEPILKNVRERLEFLRGVGLEYMSLSRKAQTLS
jgi:excinuclease ABC subunit A